MNQAKTVALLTGLTVLFVFVGRMLGGNQGMVFAFVLVSAMNFGSYWFSDKIVLKMYRAQEVSAATHPDLFSMVGELAQRAELPMPKVYVIPQDTPNAFATGRNPEHAAVAVTRGILRLLSREELMGVLAHELTHVKNRDILIGSIAATIAGAISMIASIARWGAIFGGFGDDEDGGGNIIFVMIFTMIASLAAMLIQMAISRSREYLADEGGATISGNPHYLAAALAKLDAYSKRLPMQKANPATAHMFIVNPLTGAKMSQLFSTHPSTEERISRLERMARN
ncbi:MAG: zinc metalloprotease HtpX [Deltaproteobacteria bacterium]|nr:zinc metalloprotease HtpX [Candidatus Anaeroferrophillus wilburensis]MBN2889024.1 zinc metalloprotease HtpX [Deltaproteobacteria bacterium]